MTDIPPGDDATPLEGVDAARWQTVRAQILAVAEAAASGALDDDTLAGGLAAIAQVPLDTAKIVNAMHIPEDAGAHAEALERMLLRIPDGWGRRIGCGPGWYPLITELDRQLAALLPGYEIHQVKEKYGTLRFYWDLPASELECCRQRQQQDPRPAPAPAADPLEPSSRTTAAKVAFDAWLSRETAHLRSAEHEEKERQAEIERAQLAAAAATARALVGAAEERSAHLCERCGADGTTRARGGWLKTLCGVCATHLGYPSERG